MTKLIDALREKYPDAKSALKALGLDENLLSSAEETKTMARPTKFASFLLPLVMNAIKPYLAQDAKIDLMPVFKDLSTKNYKAKKVKMALDSALKGKLAEDAEPHMGHVAALLDHIEHTVGEPKTLDESVSEAQHKAMGAAAGGKSNIGIPKNVGEEFMKADKGKSWDAGGLSTYLQDHGLDEEAIKGAMDLLPHVEEEKEEGEDREPGEEEWSAEDAEEESEGEHKKDLESEEEGAREHEKEDEGEDKFPRRGAKDKKRAADKAAADKAAKDKMPKHALDSQMVTKQAMDAAIEAATKATVDRLRAIDKAKTAIRPYVGELSMAFDSADAVYAAALKARDVNIKGIHPSAYPTILELLPKAGARAPEGKSEMGMDEERMEKINQRYPGLARIQQA